MIIDGHEHVMLPTETQIRQMDQAGVEKAVLFPTTPHIEKAGASTLAAIDAEMQVLYRLLSGGYSVQERAEQMKETIRELKESVAAAPDRFYGFGAVPLGLSAQDTAFWIETQVVGNAFRGVGEFTPGSERQMEQLEPVFQAAAQYRSLPIWVHTFHPVTRKGIHILMALCRKYPAVPVIWGHMGGVHWMEVLSFARETRNAYVDLSAAYTPLSVRTALTEIPEKCFFGSDAPFGDPYLSRQLIERASPSAAAAKQALGENFEALLSR